MELALTTAAGARSQSVLEVSDEAFNCAFNEALVHQVVTAYLAAARAGTRAQKSRAAVRGGGRKPWRQKGTGQARAGTIRSPLWRGGGKTFAAVPAGYRQKVNKKMYRAALRSIVSELVRQERLVVVEDFGAAGGKTKALAGQIKALGVAGDVLVVADNPEAGLYLAARNLRDVEVADAAGVDPVSLVGHEKVVMTVGAVQRLAERLA